MYPRKPLAIWQNSAQRGRSGSLAFAMMRALGDTEPRAEDACICQDCYPTLPLWPGPVRVGLLFDRRLAICATFRPQVILGFPVGVNPVEQGSITTLKRGRSPCINPLSFWHSCPQPCRAACKMTANARWPVRRAARLLPVPPALTRSPARLSAARAVRCAVKLALASASKHTLPAGGVTATFRTTRGNPRVVFCLAQPGEGTCSRKS